jgi:hypothetical protein
MQPQVAIYATMCRTVQIEANARTTRESDQP